MIYPPWKPVQYTIDTERGENDLAVAGGGLWSTYQTIQNNLYLYDGLPTKDVSLDLPSTLLSYDIESKHWSTKRVYPETDGERPLRFSRGTSVEVPDASGKSFYIGGVRMYHNASIGAEESWYYPVKQQVVGMAVRNGEFDKRFEGMTRGRKTIGAAVTYIPYGEEGSLITIGGTDEGSDRARKEEAWIYDIKSKKWHVQETTGTGPWERMGACAVSAYDHETHTTQVFLYGDGSGSRLFGMDDKSFMGDLFVLQLPSFQWFAYNDRANAPAARTRHTCHVINDKQMLILGGGRNDTLSANKGLKETCTWDEMSVLDMTLLEWQQEYRPTSVPYTIPEDVKKSSMFQGRIVQEPATGWSSPDLQVLFQAGDSGLVEAVPVAEDKIAGLKKPVFIGIISVVGSSLVLLLAVFRICLRKRRKEKKRRIVDANPVAWHLGPQDMTMISPGMASVPSHQPYDPNLPITQTRDKDLYHLPPGAGHTTGPALPAEMSSEGELERVEIAGTSVRYELPTTVVTSPRSPPAEYIHPASRDGYTPLCPHSEASSPVSHGIMRPVSEIEDLGLDTNADPSAGLPGSDHVRTSAESAFSEGNVDETSTSGGSPKGSTE
ncbi:unnamed protein product [Tuber aestivum]|uniref:Kelch repeat protein n=1 Tax=Tuber aestivum TaxID=59557 RepID=A0A292Q908_9PEZI|nr:unnamed protein product [Tuber aestivum]